MLRMFNLRGINATRKTPQLVSDQRSDRLTTAAITAYGAEGELVFDSTKLCNHNMLISYWI